MSMSAPNPQTKPQGRAKDSPTKQRIRDTARALFNTHGYGNVTIARLAEALGMAEGNLWYHYQTKKALVLAVQRDFADRCQTDFRIAERDDPIAAYTQYLRAWRGLLDDFRFLFIDGGAYGSFVEDVGYDLPAGMRDTVRLNHRLLEGLDRAGHVHDTDANLRDRAEHALVLMTFYLPWVTMSAPAEQAEAATARDAVEQHLIVLEGLVKAPVLARIREGLVAPR